MKRVLFVAILALFVAVLGIGWLAIPRLRTAPFIGRLGKICVALSTFALLCFLYALFIEADWLQVTHQTVTTSKWENGKRIRIGLISDLHVDQRTRALERLVTEVRAAKLDVLLFTGDSINSLEGREIFRHVMGGLDARIGRYAVRGNHDTARWPKVDLFGMGVATELAPGLPTVIDDGSMVLCGAAFDRPEWIGDCLAAAPKSAFTVMLFHTPDLVESIDPKPDLYVAGHTHGGQVALPFYGALVTFSRFDKKYEAGRFDVGRTALYVNRGIGFEPHLPRVRFFARPELTIIDVEGMGSPAPQ